MKIIGKRVLVERKKKDETTKSGIILATNQKSISRRDCNKYRRFRLC